MNTSMIAPKPVSVGAVTNPTQQKSEASPSKVSVNGTCFSLPETTAAPATSAAMKDFAATLGASGFAAAQNLLHARALKSATAATPVSEVDVKTKDSVDEEKPTELTEDPVDTSDTDACLDVVKSKNKKNADRKKKRRQTLLAKAKATTATAATAISITATTPEATVSFTLYPLCKDLSKKANDITCVWETTDHFADRLYSFKEEDAGECHNWKRLNFSLIMFSYIERNADDLSHLTFPDNPTRGQFLATARFSPKGYQHVSKNKPQKNKSLQKKIDLERVHIALLNKIVVKDAKGVMHVLQDTLTVNSVETSLHKFFNTCDILSKTANAIDGFMEYHLREKAVGLCADVKSKKITAVGASFNLAQDYLKHLGWIGQSFQPEKELAQIRSNKSQADKFIDGMVKGTKDFLVKVAAQHKVASPVETSFKPSGNTLYELE